MFESWFLEKSNLRVFWYEILFLYYSYCSSSLGFANLFCFLFTIPDFFVACFLALPFFFFFFPNYLLMETLWIRCLTPLPLVLGNSWVLIFQLFSAICLLFCILLRLLMLLLLASKSLTLYLILETFLAWFSQVRYRFLGAVFCHS